MPHRTSALTAPRLGERHCCLYSLVCAPLCTADSAASAFRHVRAALSPASPARRVWFLCRISLYPLHTNTASGGGFREIRTFSRFSSEVPAALRFIRVVFRRIRAIAGFSIWKGGVRQSDRAGRPLEAADAKRGPPWKPSEATTNRQQRKRFRAPLRRRVRPPPQRRGAGYAAKAFATDTKPRGGSRVQTGGAVKLRSASEKRPVNAMPPSACASRRKPAFGAAAHRSQKIGGAKALFLIGGAEPEREERRGDTQTDAGAPFPERRDTAGGQTHPTAAHRKRLRAGTAMRECGNSLHPLEHAPPGRPSLQVLALAAERYAECRSRNAGKAFRGRRIQPRGLGAPQLGQAKSRIAAAHVPNSFRLRLGVPVLFRLRTVRPPEAASRSPPHDPRLSEAAI